MAREKFSPYISLTSCHLCEEVGTSHYREHANQQAKSDMCQQFVLIHFHQQLSLKPDLLSKKED